MRKIVRRRVILPAARKRQQEKAARVFLSLIPPPPPAQAPNKDFYTLIHKKPRVRKKRFLNRRRAKRARLLNELLNLRSRPSSVTVPNVTNIALTSAESVLHNAGLLDNTIYQPSLTIAAGTVIHQDPAAGIPVAYGTTVNLIVSSGAALVPNEIGRQIALALADVLALGLLPRVSQIPSFSAPPGTVVKQEPLPGDRVLIGSPVFFTVVIAPLPGAVRSLLPSTEDIVNVVTIIQS
jgi:hypothetical protein